MPASSSASFRTLLLVQRQDDSGSPRVAGSTSFSRSGTKVGSFCRALLRPPPGRRMRPVGCVLDCSNSRNPCRITWRDMPVVLDTTEIPPVPHALLSAATNNRRDFSSNTGSKQANRSRTPARLSMSLRIAQNILRWKCYFLTLPYYRFMNGVPLDVTAYNTPTVSKTYLNADFGLYAMDTWHFKRLSITAGLRWEYLSAKIEPESAPAGRFVPARSFGQVDCSTVKGLGCFKD